MAKKKLAPLKIVGTEPEKRLSERLAGMSQTIDNQKHWAKREAHERKIRKLIEDAKSFLALSSLEGEQVEVYESDGGMYIHYDDLDLYPVDERLVYLVWPCRTCGVKTTSQSPATSWDALGAMIRSAQAGDFVATEGHECDGE